MKKEYKKPKFTVEGSLQSLTLGASTRGPKDDLMPGKMGPPGQSGK